MASLTGPKSLLHRAAIFGEKLFERIRPPATGQDGVVIEPYLGYATPETLVVRGRVLTALRRSEPDPRQSRWTNIRQMASLFLTDEVANVEVTALGVSARTDEEGYFTLHLPRSDHAAGWIEIPVHAPAIDDTEVAAPVLVMASDARFAIVSDIDDTVLVTGAYSLARQYLDNDDGQCLDKARLSRCRRLSGVSFRKWQKSRLLCQFLPLEPPRLSRRHFPVERNRARTDLSARSGDFRHPVHQGYPWSPQVGCHRKGDGRRPRSSLPSHRRYRPARCRGLRPCRRALARPGGRRGASPAVRPRQSRRG